MKLKLNNKIFEGFYDENGKLIVSLDSHSNKLFFKTWQDKSKNCPYKKDYVKNVDFVKETECGTLKNCFPLFGANEDFATLFFDSFEQKVLVKN